MNCEGIVFLFFIVFFMFIERSFLINTVLLRLHVLPERDVHARLSGFPVIELRDAGRPG